MALFFSLALGIVGVTVLVVTFFGPGVVYRQLTKGVLNQVVWTQFSADSVFERFQGSDDAGPPDVIKFYLWNVTNVADVRDGARPILQEVGPYVYRKTRVRRDVQFNREGLVSFADASWITALDDPDGHDAAADVICTLNLPLLGVLRTIEDKLNGTMKRLAEITLAEVFGHRRNREGLFMRRTAAELLFGYEDELLAAMARVLPSLKAKVTFRLVENGTDAAISPEHPRTVMDSGLMDVSNVWDYREWRGLREVSCWNDHSERVHGSDAQQFRPFLSMDESVYVFVGELFRAAKLNVTAEMTVQGIKLFKYMPDDRQGRPDPRFFGEIDGLMNVSACVAVGPDGEAGDVVGPDILMSFPHFCYVDPAVAEQTEGTECDHSRHDLWLAVEPITGITMQAAKRLQVASTFDDRYAAFDPNVRSTILPIFWAEELVTIDRAAADAFKSSVYKALDVIKLLESRWLTALGVTLVLVAALSAVLLMSLRTTAAENRDLLPDTNGHVDSQTYLERYVVSDEAHEATDIREPLYDGPSEEVPPHVMPTDEGCSSHVVNDNDDEGDPSPLARRLS